MVRYRTLTHLTPVWPDTPLAGHRHVFICSACIFTLALSAPPLARNFARVSRVPRMSSLEYHVLLALAGGPLHGYAVKQRVEDESAGSLTPQPGSLYRVIARLMTSGLVAETDPKGPA